jgi:hypothetical protein
MLTEKDAWITLAGIWSKATPHDRCPYHCAPLNGDWVMGVCGTISVLLSCNMIDVPTWETMRKKLRKYGNDNEIMGGFYWPHDAEGARQRSLFCSQQAEALLGR